MYRISGACATQDIIPKTDYPAKFPIEYQTGNQTVLGRTLYQIFGLITDINKTEYPVRPCNYQGL